MALTGLNRPDFHTIAEFRERHLAALSGLFVQAWLVHEQGIPVFDKSTRKDSTFSRFNFTYDHQRDLYMRALIWDSQDHLAPRCVGSDYARSGVVCGHRRYRCRTCGCHFTDTPVRGNPPTMKALAVLLCGMGGASFSMIGRVLDVSDVAVLKWVRRSSRLAGAEGACGCGDGRDRRDAALHQKSLPSSGSGLPVPWISGELWPGCWVGVMMRPAAVSSTRSA